MSTNDESVCPLCDGVGEVLVCLAGGNDSHSCPQCLAQLLDEKDAEITRLQSALSALTRAHHELGEREAKLRTYLSHRALCTVEHGTGCTCGLSALVKPTFTTEKA